MRKLLLLCLFVMVLHADRHGYVPHDRSEYEKIANIYQNLSLHADSGFDVAKAGANIRFGVGWNYLGTERKKIDSNFKYFYGSQKRSQNKRSRPFGLILYIHPFTYYMYPNAPIIQPKSFAIGYMEHGVALSKSLPVSVDIMYRANFYGRGRINTNKETHGSVFFKISKKYKIFAR